jgi:branched-chain amino acid transport system substrate-binding protein
VRVHRYSRSGSVVVAVAIGIAGVSACGSSSPSSSASTASASAASGTPIKIGNVGVYSGPSGTDDQAGSLAVTAWADEVNASGGIDGHPVQLVVKDDRNVAANSVLAVKELIQQDHVVALVGNNESGLEAAWASYADAQKVPVIGGDDFAAQYNTDPNFFPVAESGIDAAVGYVNAVKLFGGKIYSQVVCAEYPACKQADALATYYGKALGVKTVSGQGIAEASTNYTAQCEALKEAGADLVFTATSRVAAERFIANCKQQGYAPQFTNNPGNWEASATTNPVWQGAILTSSAPLWFGDGPGTSEYLAAMKKYEPKAVVNARGTGSWYAAKVFQAALEAAFKAQPTTGVTAQTVYDGLYALGPNFDLGGIIAPVTYAQGKPAAQNLCNWYAVVKNGTLTAPKGTGPICPPDVTPPPAG